MKPPWDRKYIKIAFHVIITFVIIYIFKILIDSLTFTVANLKSFLWKTGEIIGQSLSILSPIVAGFVIAYVLDPVVEFFQRKYDGARVCKTRLAGTAITYGLICLALTAVGLYAAKTLNGEATENIIETVDYFVLNGGIRETLEKSGIYKYISGYVDALIGWLNQAARNIADNLLNFTTVIASGVVTLLIGIVIAFYFLKDKEKIQKKLREISYTFLPKSLDIALKNILGDINAVFSGYIRGQLTDAIIMGILIATGLFLIKVRYAVIIGLLSGFSNVIPYFGAIMGLLLSVLAAFLSGEPLTAVYAAIIVVILQQIDTIYIVPKIVGRNVELSPVAVILAVAVAGKSFGLIGMIFAVPITAIAKIFLERWFERRQIKRRY